MEQLTALCGCMHSKHGKRPFTMESLAQHEANCPDCWDARMKEELDDPDAYEMAELIADDESDGVFWGIYHELSGDL